MSLAVFAVEPEAPIPRQVCWEFTCDGEHSASLFGPQVGRFDSYGQAMKAGWKETFMNGERRFLGPCCSGKAAA